MKTMTQFNKLKPTEKLSEHQFYTVVKIQGTKVQLKNDFGEDIVVDKDYVEKCITSAEQFATEQDVTRTEAAQIFLNHRNIAMTVDFNKQVKSEDVRKTLFDLYPNKGGKILSEADYQKKVKDALKTALEGEERVMVGRHNGSQDEFGRVHFVDMEVAKDPTKTYDVRQRLVDPRTINYLIVNNIKYKAK